MKNHLENLVIINLPIGENGKDEIIPLPKEWNSDATLSETIMLIRNDKSLSEYEKTLHLQELQVFIKTLKVLHTIGKNSLNKEQAEMEMFKMIQSCSNMTFIEDNRPSIKTCKECFTDIRVTQETFDKKEIFICRQCKEQQKEATRTRHALQLIKAKPIWVSTEEIRKIYKEAKEKSAKDKILYHVDHIVPLISDIVSGLHVPWNLRIITAKENLEKSNKFEVQIILSNNM